MGVYLPASGWGREDVPVTMVNDMKTTNFAIGKATLHDSSVESRRTLPEREEGGVSLGHTNR